MLRRQGKTYSEIQQICVTKFDYKPSKGTLNSWLASLEYTEQEQKLIEQASKGKNVVGSLRAGATQKRKKQERIDKVKENLNYDFDIKELKTLGLALYWGEGTKYKDNVVEIANTDVTVHKLFIVWVEKCYGIQKSQLKFHLYTYKGADIEENIEYWCQELGVKKEQFTKPYIRDKYSPYHKKHKNYKGTLSVRIYNTELWHEINLGIEEIKKYFSG